MKRTTSDSEPTPEVFRDPITGTTPVGPIQTEPPPEEQRPRGRWSTMAKWFLVALIGMAVVAFVAWYY